MDRELKALRSKNTDRLELNTMASNEHVTKIERQIEVINEQEWEIRSTLLHKKLSR